MLKVSVLFAMISLMVLSACSSISIGSRVGEIKINTKKEQPKVIVNSDEKTSAKYLSTDRSDI
jgi:hypothetical protein